MIGSLLFYLFTFFLGSAVGSFVGVIVDRVMGNEAIWKGRSHCDHCRHKLHWNDLIPVFSYFMLKGKCRYCHEKLSLFYPIIEIVTGVTYAVVAFALFGGAWYFIGNLNYLLLLLFYYALIGSLIAILFTDMKFGIIPFKVVLFAVVITLAWYLLIPSLYFSSLELQMLGLQTNLLNAIASGLGVALFFFSLFFFTKGRGMGFGDVVYAFLMGFILGFPKVLLALYLAFITGAIIALFLVASKKKKFKGGTIPFGPFLVFGTIVSMLWGNTIIGYVLSYFMLF